MKLNILLDLVMNYNEIIKIFDLGTLNHYRLSDVQILSVDPFNSESPFKPADKTRSIYYAAGLYDLH